MRGKVFFWDHRFFFHFGAKSVKKGFAVNVAWVCVVVLCFIFRIVQVLFDWSLGCCVMFVLGGSMCAFKYVCVQEWIDWNTSLGFTLSDWKKYFGGFLVIHEFLHIPPFFVPDEQTVVLPVGPSGGTTSLRLPNKHDE